MSEVAFVDLPQDDFPFTIKGINADTKETIWELRVEGPGVLHIPGKPNGVREVDIRLEYPDGQIVER